MTYTQSDALWEICRQGLPMLADEAEHCWDNGEVFELQPEIRVDPSLESLISQCNWEAHRTRQPA